MVLPLVVQEDASRKLVDEAMANDRLIGLVVSKTSELPAAYEREISMEMTADAMKELEDRGMILLGPPKDEAEWQRRAQSIWPQFYDNVGGKEWVDQALALIKG